MSTGGFDVLRIALWKHDEGHIIFTLYAGVIYAQQTSTLL
jgi:hypothetical protein